MHTTAGTEGAAKLMANARNGIATALPAIRLSMGVEAGWGEAEQALPPRQPDVAPSHTKLSGRNEAFGSDPALAAGPPFRGAKLRSVHRLLSEGGARIVFQPIWSLHPRTVLGYEALARPDPKYGLSGPQEAFDIAAQLGRAAALDAICRRQAIAGAARLPRGAFLFINVSPYTLVNGHFSCISLREELAGTELGPERIVFELTERSPIKPELLAGPARQLREAGFKIAVDDVGAGNNGLAMLRHVPLDYVKVDREILLGAVDGGSARATFVAILAFGAESGARVIVEGVETEAQLGFVEKLVRRVAPASAVIPLIQGFLLGRPSSRFVPRHAPKVAP